MKSIFTIALALLYTITNIGVVVNTHYCMGKVADVSVGNSKSAACNKCGMENKGCCHDEPQFIKLSVEQQVSSTINALPQFVLQNPISFIYSIVNYYNPITAIKYVLIKPLISSSRNILFCIFRI